MDLAGIIAMQITTLVGTVAASKATVSSLQARVRELERARKDMPNEYVPRREVELALKGIESSTKHTNSMVQSLIYSGNDYRLNINGVQAAAAGRAFTQICIEGLDGHGGLNRWEGRTPFLYLDTREVEGRPKPLVTIGVGCAVDLGEALTLPFLFAGRAATGSEIASDFAAIQAAPFGMVADEYARYTGCRLPESAIDELVRKRFALFVPALRRLFPGFDNFPETVKAGCLDLIYGVGLGGLAPPKYPHFRAAVNARDWASAALHCLANADDEAYRDRNEARRQLFLQAVAP